MGSRVRTRSAHVLEPPAEVSTNADSRLALLKFHARGYARLLLSTTFPGCIMRNHNTARSSPQASCILQAWSLAADPTSLTADIGVNVGPSFLHVAGACYLSDSLRLAALLQHGEQTGHALFCFPVMINTRRLELLLSHHDGCRRPQPTPEQKGLLPPPQLAILSLALPHSVWRLAFGVWRFALAENKGVCPYRRAPQNDLMTSLLGWLVVSCFGRLANGQQYSVYRVNRDVARWTPCLFIFFSCFPFLLSRPVRNFTDS